MNGSLFDPRDLELPDEGQKTSGAQKAPASQPASIKSDAAGEVDFWASKTVGFRSASEALTGFSHGDTVHTVSHGCWNQSDLLDYLQTITGPAECTIATWSVSEAGVRRIVEMRNDGRITRLNALINRQMLNWQGAAAAMLCQSADEHGVGYCHAKTYVTYFQYHISNA